MNGLWESIFRSKTDEETLAGFLAKIPVFTELGKRDLNYLENLVHVRNYKAHETVFEQGDPGSGLYIIRSGNVAIFTRDNYDREEELALLGPGDFFGETTLASPAPRTVSARTTESCELLGLFRSDLLATSDKHPEIANRILFGLTKMISERLQTATFQLRNLQQRLEEKESPQS
ncbi:cyclic nucleotide-binding domain-containing protein [Desulfuromonas acetoxidans]|uniref:Cyclic nucleotide-binding protein n=1 Tax=Desulfuromonas acetoxidans (strain DSM 684 / 11070) TaxID=281689 RepID=Q1K2E6_DESA6|nr:cyclic nucleotide-binding domain-containing protein [Desulfuromonas acetoxidans]EAT16493.1 cyclic nucleotide-binding protein [Desulfuromonas acetoxidans DSM 684]MBF0647072.1 cyclic nucleotide-binding domain-containing protein [Desulfuromonas acetoxidans]NVD26211.1 cyclic nucleotide-binding domain-containing protein [Desulfuromonas acetoxidans]NVE14853.1 cyclic nucleotide-binding domain-containing protein [Desulfuromonas acetoxidans]